MEKQNKLEKCFLHIILIALAFIFFFLFIMFRYVPVNADAGYYIPISKAVMNGAVPTYDIETAYTPFAYYMFALWMKIWGMQFEYLALLMHLVTVINSVLLYIILSKFVTHNILRIFLSFSYYCTAMRLGGHFIILEPFQILFVLVAFIVYLSNIVDLIKYCLVGVFLGISIMFKQYSALFLMSFCVMVYYESIGDKTFWRRVYVLAIIFITSSIPFLLFVLFSKAQLVTSLISFGFISNKAVSYAAKDHSTLLRLAYDIIIKLYYYNWLFIPLLLYLPFFLFNKKRHSHEFGIITIFLFSCLPLMVRQFSHYFLLIAPWSYMLWAFLLSDALKEIGRGKDIKAYLTFSVVFCLFVILPVFLLMGQRFEEIDIIIIRSLPLPLPLRCPGIVTSSIFILLNIIILLMSKKLSGGKRINNFAMVIVLLAICLGLQSIFSSMSQVIMNDWKEEKESQLLEARKINSVFEKGSSVLIVGIPRLYVSCDFVNPFGDYGFINDYNVEQKMDENDWDKVEKVIQRKNYPLISEEILCEMGFTKLPSIDSLDYTLFRKNNEILPTFP